MEDRVCTMKDPIRKYELIGTGVIFGLGAVMHFAFEWSGELKPIAVFAAVNESVWEHLKLAYWPTLLYAAIEYRTVREFTNNFIIAKSAGIYVVPAAITALFYGYTAITGSDNLIADISIFAAAVALGQLVSYKILSRRRLPRPLYLTGLVALISLGVIYAAFTFYPPQLPIFRDPNSGLFGIP
jgi:hypothetical protein